MVYICKIADPVMAAALSVHIPTQKDHFSCPDILPSSDLNNSAPDGVGLYSSLLFQSKDDILTVLVKHISNSQYKAVRESILSFLAGFVPRVEDQIYQYAVSIQKCCMNIFQRDKYSRNKEKALQIIIHDDLGMVRLPANWCDFSSPFTNEEWQTL
ncbi:unnamed protein product [Clavelina lepadiformis]|uniref:DNA-PKcs N-terminal domain-containing protein n=1 Tax=Clavelina lepadiformis TaxID=159417 RepID=A0ABP0G5F2_CLALP